MSCKVDVIIPTFNRKTSIKRAIDSVLRQTFKGFNLIVIDDGSTDGTGQEVTPYESEGLLTYLKIENQGVSHARNFAVKNSSSEWISFLDSDDEWLPNKLEKQFELLEKKDVPLVHGEEIWIRNGKRVNQKKIHQKFGGDIFDKCIPRCVISPSASLIKRSVYNEFNGFREDFVVCEDYDLWLKICSKYEVGFVSTPIIKKYGGHDDQLSAKFFAMDFWRVLALEDILERGNLTDENQKKVVDTILSKSKILLAGYEKHNNMENFEKINLIVKKINGGDL